MEPRFSAPTLEARDRAIAPEVIEQAREWKVFLDLDDTPEAGPLLAGPYLRCYVCEQGVTRIGKGHRDRIKPALFSAQALEAAVVSHVLQVHRRDVDPGWSGS